MGEVTAQPTQKTKTKVPMAETRPVTVGGRRPTRGRGSGVGGRIACWLVGWLARASLHVLFVLAFRERTSLGGSAGLDLMTCDQIKIR